VLLSVVFQKYVLNKFVALLLLKEQKQAGQLANVVIAQAELT
jgi:hypothetical protein